MRLARNLAAAVIACMAACSSTHTQPDADAGTLPSARGPAGIYAYVVVEDYMARPADQSQSNVDAYLSGIYASLLANPAVAGLDMRVHWATLNPEDPATSSPYAWDSLDLAFAAVAQWNADNPTARPKNIHLNLIPGFESPAWLFDHMTSCDPPVVPTTPFVPPGPASPSGAQPCDYSYFLETEGVAPPYASRPLPMPWSPTYVAYWRGFLGAVAARYGKNPTFVSIAIGGPTASSTEMIMPHDANIDPSTMKAPYATQWQSDLVHWNYLFATHDAQNPDYQNSDQAFIDGWIAAVDMYGAVFDDVTLVATTGDGLPDFSASSSTIPSALQPACTDPDMDCAAQATILAHFLDPTVDVNDAKAVEEEGFGAMDAYVDIDFDGAVVKWLAKATGGANPTLGGAPVSPVLGGLEEGTSFSVREMAMGCLKTAECPDAEAPSERCVEPCSASSCPVTLDCTQPDSGAAPSAEQTLYNMLQAYFDRTPYGDAFGMTLDTAHLNFFQLYAPDIFFAQGMEGCTSTNFVDQQNDAGADAGLTACTLPNPGSTIVTASGVVFSTDQQLLEQAESLLVQMASTPRRQSALDGGE